MAKLYLDKLTPEVWKDYSEKMHLNAFGEYRASYWDRVDFVLVGRTEDYIAGFVTCKEIDAETVYWQFGGALTTIKNTVNSWFGYRAFVEHCKLHYKRITMLIKNDNATMLKFAMKMGFKIIGVRNFKGDILLDHLMEFET